MERSKKSEAQKFIPVDMILKTAKQMEKLEREILFRILKEIIDAAL